MQADPNLDGSPEVGKTVEKEGGLTAARHLYQTTPLHGARPSVQDVVPAARRADGNGRGDHKKFETSDGSEGL